MATTVTTKGQVTIPKPVRDLLGIGPGSKVDFRRAADGSVVLSRADRNSQQAALRSCAAMQAKGLRPTRSWR